MKEWICKEEPIIRSDGSKIGVGFRQMVELVRCKDCKHNGNPKKCIIASYCELKGEYPFPFLTNDWFCADGEKSKITL